MHFLKRNLTNRLLEALSDTSVVLLHGARQTGKSTLVKELSREFHPARYLTFDDATTMSVARRDPLGFLEAYEGPIILDEVQRVPEIFVAIKALVDRERVPALPQADAFHGVLVRLWEDRGSGEDRGQAYRACCPNPS